jgi:hypothetical protein
MGLASCFAVDSRPAWCQLQQALLLLLLLLLKGLQPLQQLVVCLA